MVFIEEKSRLTEKAVSNGAASGVQDGGTTENNDYP